MKRTVDGQAVPENSQHNEEVQILIRSLLNPAPGDATIMNKGRKIQKKQSMERIGEKR